MLHARLVAASVVDCDRFLLFMLLSRTSRYLTDDVRLLDWLELTASFCRDSELADGKPALPAAPSACRALIERVQGASGPLHGYWMLTVSVQLHPQVWNTLSDP